jgi:hypothetical protein
MLSRLPIVVLAALAGLILLPRAEAWNNTGHQAVALIACFELDDGSKKAMFDLLKNHPHTNIAIKGGMNFFTAERPAGVNEVDWAILRAATWPDFVRPPKFSHLTPEQIKEHEIYKYHDGDRHFINKPFVVKGFKGQVPPDKVTTTILEGLKNAERDLKDTNLPKAKRAVALCWLLHLVGDLHQPLHCTILVSKDFPDGDRGGNSFLIGSTNLHSYWDELLGGDKVSFAHLENLTLTIHRAPQWQKDKLKELKTSGYEAWADESFALAVTVAYRNGELSGAHKNHGHDDGALEIPPFPSDYRDEAQPIAQRRIAVAGYRLAEKLGAIFP